MPACSTSAAKARPISAGWAPALVVPDPRVPAGGRIWCRSPFSPPTLFGAAWAFIPAYLQAKRGSHIVITTIMFNFIAAALMVYLLVNVLIRPAGRMAPESRGIR